MRGQPPQLGWQLKSGVEWSPLVGLSELSAGAWPTRRSLKDAESDLWRTLKKRQLIASGRPIGGGVRQEIPALRWRDLRMFEAARKLVVSDSVSLSSGFADVAFDSAKVRKRWPITSGAGRPTKYDWVSFEAEVIRILNEEGDINPKLDPKWTQAALEEKMAEWCSDQWNKEPSESMIRQRVKQMRSNFAEGR